MLYSDADEKKNTIFNAQKFQSRKRVAYDFIVYAWSFHEDFKMISNSLYLEWRVCAYRPLPISMHVTVLYFK